MKIQVFNYLRTLFERSFCIVLTRPTAIDLSLLIWSSSFDWILELDWLWKNAHFSLKSRISIDFIFTSLSSWATRVLISVSSFFSNYFYFLKSIKPILNTKTYLSISLRVNCTVTCISESFNPRVSFYINVLVEAYICSSADGPRSKRSWWFLYTCDSWRTWLSLIINCNQRPIRALAI